MAFVLGKRSLERLNGVHPDLVKVVKLAITKTKFDFTVIEGVRSREKQAENVRKGVSKTMNSRHLTGHAVDIAPLIGGKIPWDDKGKFNELSETMFKCADELGVAIRWGGDWNENGEWKDERFYDGPHFELRRKEYP
ncbi:hypothetical protein [Salmonella phage SSBI34]|nr:hypothetical protein [Salmonella phage SSBI34]